MEESVAGKPMKLEEKPNSEQFELKLYDHRCLTGTISRCQLCRNIARRRFPFTLTAEVGIFQEFSAQCTTCSAIYDSLTNLGSSLQIPSWRSMKFRFNASSGDTPRFYASEVTLENDENRESKSFQLFTELGQTSIEPVIGAARSIAEESNSSQCFDLIWRWISDCDRHPDCAFSPGPSNLPTRVLDLQLSRDAVRVYTTQGEEADPYIALSHCWGPNGLPDTAKTTRMTFESRTQSIEINTLPKTFRDAISICRDLGIRFLWIDSLCIIQQDAEDWEKESSRMRDVYRNSYLTISVARSRESLDGCFSTRQARHLSTKVGVVKHRGQSCNVLARESVSHYQMSSSDSYTPEFPLFSRAWTFQERLLPRRVVHYAEGELIWECNTLCDCECAASRELLSGWEWQKSTKLIFSDMMSQPRQGSEFRRNWAILMRRFSLMKLSFDADRLPSLSGLAQALKCEQTGEYLAGLWEKELSWMIGWISMGSDACRPSSKPTPPSWSWTSLENAWISWNYSPDLSKHNEWTTVWPKGGDLSVHDTSFEIIQCTIKSVSCIPLGKYNAFGRVSSGILVVSGRLISVVLRDKYFCERNGIRQRFTLDAPSEPEVYEDGQILHCLMIGAMSEESSKYPGLVNVSSLILKAHGQVEDEASPMRRTYERIGIMTQNNHFAWKEAPAWWRGAEEAVVEIV